MHTHEIIEIILTKVALCYECKWQQIVKPYTQKPSNARIARATAIVLLCRYEDFVLNGEMVASIFGINPHTLKVRLRIHKAVANIYSLDFRIIEKHVIDELARYKLINAA